MGLNLTGFTTKILFDQEIVGYNGSMDKLTIIPMLPVWLIMCAAHKIMAKNGDPLADLAALAAAIRTR